MNYAVDRLDRRTRHPRGVNGLFQDYQQGLQEQDQELVARTLRDVGWNRHAVYHAAQRWMLHPESSDAAGDYAQLADLNGFPEIGMLALFTFRSKGALKDPMNYTETNGHYTNTVNIHKMDEKWLLQPCPQGHCGCGDPQCGVNVCFVPMLDMTVILSSLDDFLSEVRNHHDFVSDSRQIHNALQKGQCFPSDWIPDVLRFWDESLSNDEPSFRRMPTVLQFLLVKLLYITIPLLGVESAIRVDTEQAKSLSASHKSHHAYFILIRALILGKRIKSKRPKTKFPIWDRIQYLFQPTNDGDQEEPAVFSKQLQHVIEATNYPPKDHSPLSPCFCPYGLSFQKDNKPLFILGDSHVLSISWLRLEIPSSSEPGEPACMTRLAIPAVVTGLKAWHVRRETSFFTNTNLQRLLLERLGGSSSLAPATLVVSAGEIDCREGLGGPILEGYSSTHSSAQADHVRRTVQAYVDALEYWLSTSPTLEQILVMPVAPHAKQSTGRVAGQQSRRQAIQSWNAELRRHLADGHNGVFFLDYEQHLLSSKKGDPTDDYILHSDFDADGTHLNCYFNTYFARAIAECNCDLSLL